jgi:hypothetical protein
LSDIICTFNSLSTITQNKNEDDKSRNELETFLNIIKLTHLTDTFAQHKVSLKDLLCFKNEEDLEKVNFGKLY